MATNVTFYSYSGDPRVANKSMTVVGAAVALEPFETIGDLSIRMIIDYQGGLLDADYFYAEGKYYRITERSKMTATRMAITGTVDPLTTYWGQIAGCPCVVSRNSVVNNWWVADDKRVNEQWMTNQYLHIVDIGEPSAMVLMTLG